MKPPGASGASLDRPVAFLERRVASPERPVASPERLVASPDGPVASARTSCGHNIGVRRLLDPFMNLLLDSFCFHFERHSGSEKRPVASPDTVQVLSLIHI